MIAEIIRAEEYRSEVSGRLAVRMRVLVDGDIGIVFVSPATPELFHKFFEWCNIPIIRKVDGISVASLERLKGKLISVTQIEFRGRHLWSLDARQIFRGK